MINKNEEEYIYQVISQLDGFELQTAEDLLNKILVMLKVTKSSIDIVRIKKNWFPELELEPEKNVKKVLKQLS